MRLIHSILIALFLIACSALSYSQECQLNGSLGVGTNPADDMKLDVDGDTKLRGNANVEGELRLTSEPLRETLLDKLLYLDDNRSVTQVPSGLEVAQAVFQLDCTPATGGNIPYWNSGLNKIYIPCTGVSVGIGISYPSHNLHVLGDGLFTSYLEVLDVLSVDKGIALDVSSESDGAYGFKVETAADADNHKSIVISQDGHEGFTAYGDGKIRIKTQSDTEYAIKVKDASQDLFVVRSNGHVHAREMFSDKVTVELNHFPDYVFEKDYKIMPLHELKKFIATNKHLPNMPTAKSVADLGELNRLLVEKVEELTLYVLGLQEQIDALKESPQNSSK